ncbi:MAG: phosphoribosyltransferase family protein [Eubacteriales bacterium]
MKLQDQILDLIFPPKCPFCRKILPHFQAECTECTLPETKDTGDTIFQTRDGLTCVSPLWYQDTVATAIKRYKFSGAKHYAPCFAAMMANATENMGEFDYVTWVPLAKVRQRSRGYNQAELLAREVTKQKGFVPESLLEKIKNNPAQTSLKSDEEREENTKDVYQLKKIVPELQNTRILLVDDVVTTGSSLYASGKILLEAGVKELVCLTFARSRK